MTASLLLSGLLQAAAKSWQRGRLSHWNYDVRVRYSPVAKAMRRANPARDWAVLDVGCGTVSVAPFCSGWSVTGLDTDLEDAPPTVARIVRGSVCCLPFQDRSWDAVTCVDVLEHLSPEMRVTALRELLRVAKRLLIVAHPAGENARKADEGFRAALVRTSRPVPQWLSEHLAHAYPEVDLVRRFVEESGTSRVDWLRVVGNESVLLQRSHRLLARHSRTLYQCWSVVCAGLLPVLPRSLDRNRTYRVVTILGLT